MTRYLGVHLNSIRIQANVDKLYENTWNNDNASLEYMSFNTTGSHDHTFTQPWATGRARLSPRKKKNPPKINRVYLNQETNIIHHGPKPPGVAVGPP